MAIYGKDFRLYLKKFVFVRSTDGIEDISAQDPDNINGYFAYIFWSNNGEICLRIADVGYGLEDYFETNDVGIDFTKENMVFPLLDKLDDILYIFDSNVVADSENYSKIVAETEMSNLIDEELINARENTEIDVFREDDNKDILTVVFFTKQLPIKSKSKVKSISFSKGLFKGELIQVPFGWKKFKKGDQIQFKIDQISGDTVLLALI